MIEVAKLARAIYADAPAGIKWKQILRPRICPFHIIIDYVPQGATILDVGCGAGLFILALTKIGRTQAAVGFDADRIAIQTAQGIAEKLPNSPKVRFEHRDANEGWPPGRFNVVSLIDVMHHVYAERQAELIATAAAHVAEGGILLYKDMARRPLWRAWANRIHDLLSAREWIHYADLNDVVAWAQAAGMDLERTGAANMLWYRHEWCIFRHAAVKRNVSGS